MANEKRLIDAERFGRILLEFTVNLFLLGKKEGAEAVSTIIKGLEAEPTVEAVEMVHGHWCWEGRFKACSRCGSYVEWTETLGASFWKFCPFCGAKMDEERKE